jgi:type I restriction enzyme M protein
MTALESDNRSLKGVLPKDYARPALDKSRLGELIDLIATIGLGDAESRKKDILGRVYEYFLGRFAEKEGKGGGEFYTPQCVVRLLVEMIEPFRGRVFDPCCGTGGMFVQAVRFIEAHSGGRDVAVYGQESNHTTWRLALMNLAIRQISGNIQWGDSFTNDKHPSLKADYILANPPFNLEDWGFSKVKEDVRWAFGTPPAGGARKQKDGSVINVDGGNANYAWIKHFVHHLSPTGIAGFVLANGSIISFFHISMCEEYIPFFLRKAPRSSSESLSYPMTASNLSAGVQSFGLLLFFPMVSILPYSLIHRERVCCGTPTS